MTETIREQIISDICLKLSEILTFDGYNVNIGNHIGRAETRVDIGDFPCASVFPGIETTEHVFGKTVCTFLIKVAARSVYDQTLKNSSEVQEGMLGDIIKCLTNPAEVVSKKIDNILYFSGGPDEYPDNEETTTATSATFEIRYKLKQGNPYEQ